MNILLTVHQFFPDYKAGTEVLTYLVARELLARGHEVRVLTAHPAAKEMQEANRFDEYEVDGIHVYRFHHAYTPMAGQTSNVAVDYDNRLAAQYFEKILKDFSPQVIHFFHLNRLGTRLIDSAVQAEIPAFMTPTDFWAICPTGQLRLCNGAACDGPSRHGGNCVKHFAQATQGGLIRSVAKWVPTGLVDQLASMTQDEVLPPYPHHNEVQAISFRLSKNISRLNKLHGIVAPTNYMKQKLIQHGVSPNLVTHCAYGINFDESCARRPSGRELRVGFIGTLAEHKGGHVLIDAFKALPPGHATLKIYGNPDDFPHYSGMLKERAKDHESIAFCGTFAPSKIAEVLSDLDVLVVPSLWYENTPLVVYSAQAFRCPVVASNVPGISEVIKEGDNGLLFEPGSAEALTKCLLRLIDKPALIAQLSEHAKRPKSTLAYVDELLTLWTGRMAERHSDLAVTV